MESESISGYEKQKEHRDNMSDDGDVSEPIRICRISSRSDENNWMGLLDYNAFVLCVGSIILLGSFLFT